MMDEKELDELFSQILEDDKQVLEDEPDEIFEIVSDYKVYPEYVDSDGVVFISENRRVPNFDHQTSIVGESDAQYIVFEMDRYYNGVDLSKKNIQIHYERPDGEGDNSPPVNVMLSDTKIRFGWIIPVKATEVVGKLKVMPFVYGTSAVSGSDLYMMKSLYVEYTIHAGLNIDSGIVKKNDEWYNQFLIQMVEYVSQAKGARDEIVGDKEEIEKIHVHIIDLVQSIEEIDYTVGEIERLRDEVRISEENARKYANEARDLVAGATQGGYIPAGTISFEDLPTDPNPGFMYNISNDFITDDRFEDGAGIKYKRGANVYCTVDKKWDVLEGVPYTKEDLGLDKVENKNSQEILGELTKNDIVDILGYTPSEEGSERPIEYGDMVGATDTTDGISGLVPAPSKGKSDRYLSSDGTWKEVDIPDIDIPEVEEVDIDNHEVEFYEAVETENISLGDSIKVIFGKLKRWFSSFSKVAFSGNYSDLNNVPISLPADGGDADTIDGKDIDYLLDYENLLNKPDIPPAATVDSLGIKSIKSDLTLSANWTGTSPPYVQSVSVQGVTSDDIIDLDVQGSVTSDQLDAYIDAKIVDGGQSTNSIILKAFGDKPEIAIPIKIVVRKV